MDEIIAVVTYYSVMAIAVERLVEVWKTLPWLGNIISRSKKTVAAVAVFSGFILTLATTDAITNDLFKNIWISAAVNGLLLSTGSGIWHDLLVVLLDLRNSLRSKLTTECKT